MGCQLLVIILSDNCHLPSYFWLICHINIAHGVVGASDR